MPKHWNDDNVWTDIYDENRLGESPHVIMLLRNKFTFKYVAGDALDFRASTKQEAIDTLRSVQVAAGYALSILTGERDA